MARLASTSIAVDFPRLRPYPFHSHQQPSHFFKFSVKIKNRLHQRVFCQTNDPNPVDTGMEEDKELVEAEAEAETSENPANGAATETALSTSPVLPEYPDKNFNRRIALGATLVAVGLFFSKRLDFGVSLKDLTAAAMTYEEALSNGKPTVVEFYADWCEVCRELAPDVYKVEQKYKAR